MESLVYTTILFIIIVLAIREIPNTEQRLLREEFSKLEERVQDIQASLQVVEHSVSDDSEPEVESPLAVFLTEETNKASTIPPIFSSEGAFNDAKEIVATFLAEGTKEAQSQPKLMSAAATVFKPADTRVDYMNKDQLRKLASQYKIQWRNVHGNGRHMRVDELRIALKEVLEG
jgi:pyruvate/2-oxoglutarate dehydrogenase complex dihydrolipoamide acyltransferase (E2) component